MMCVHGYRRDYCFGIILYYSRSVLVSRSIFEGLCLFLKSTACSMKGNEEELLFIYLWGVLWMWAFYIPFRSAHGSHVPTFYTSVSCNVGLFVLTQSCSALVLVLTSSHLWKSWTWLGHDTLSCWSWPSLGLGGLDCTLFWNGTLAVVFVSDSFEAIKIIHLAVFHLKNFKFQLGVREHYRLNKSWNRSSVGSQTTFWKRQMLVWHHTRTPVPYRK